MASFLQSLVWKTKGHGGGLPSLCGCVTLEEEIPVPVRDERSELIAALQEQLEVEDDEEVVPVPSLQQRQQQQQEDHWHL